MAFSTKRAIKEVLGVNPAELQEALHRLVERGNLEPGAVAQVCIAAALVAESRSCCCRSSLRKSARQYTGTDVTERSSRRGVVSARRTQQRRRPRFLTSKLLPNGRVPWFTSAGLLPGHVRVGSGSFLYRWLLCVSAMVYRKYRPFRYVAPKGRFMYDATLSANYVSPLRT